MFAGVTTGLALLQQIAAAVSGVFNAKTQAAVSKEEMEIALKKAVLDQGTAEFQAQVQMAIEQTKLNQILAQAGKLGWRDWLGKNVTIIFIANLWLITAMLFWSFFGVLFKFDSALIHQAISTYPMDWVKFIWSVLSGLLGFLYTARGFEKYNLINSANQGFNVKMFFDTLRSLKGSLSIEEVAMLQNAINKASSNQ